MSHAKESRDQSADTDANMEPNAGDELAGQNAVAPFNTPVRITFYHIRGRLADLDGLSVKATIDGLVEAGLLADDSPEQVAEIRHRQAKGKPEKTRIVIEEID